ncbi:unnamed protein product [Cylicostephanus goldi]|uniref:Uncharacterized protein n=1 Tax=Cylicostephanus goldi TaxID=71465 RepID=A0A3P6RX84_CYLGO|nr:unnamed protein product [Cylicostephanus goldi]
MVTRHSHASREVVVPCARATRASTIKGVPDLLADVVTRPHALPRMTVVSRANAIL